MKIGLIDIDGHNFPNLCLMKISAYCKSQGHETVLLDPNAVLLGMNLFGECDKYYGAVIFKENKELAEQLIKMGVNVGGTGLDIENKLPPFVENQFPDYGLYDIKDTAYGFLTRGCPRYCKFCIVGDKEGLTSYKVANLKDFWHDQKNIELLDPNLLACKDWEELLQQLIDCKASINVNQGMDIRFMTIEKQAMINLSNITTIHFAWDNYPDWPTYQKLKKFREGFKLDTRHLKVYVLTNFNTTHKQDLDRIYKLKEIGYDPYVMIFDKQNAPKITRYLQRWCNNKFIFRSCDKFENYDHRIGQG